MARDISSENSKILLTHKLIFDPTLKLSEENFEVNIKNAFKSKLPWRSKIEELQNVAPFPSTHEFVIFASNAYNDRNKDAKTESDFEEETRLPEGWKLLTAAVDNSCFSVLDGYFGTAFWNSDQRQILIAHRGTVPINIGDDIKDFLSSRNLENSFVSQMNSACTFAHKVCAAFESVDDLSKWQIFFTGHLLGAWLAQITTFSLKYLTVVKTQFLKNPAIGLHAHTEVFDSPGCQEMLSQMVHDFDVSYHGKAVDINNLDITNFLSSPNTINCCNSHVGVLFRIYPESASDGIDAIRTFFEQSLEAMDKIKMKRVLVWPKLQPSLSILQPLTDPKLTEEYEKIFTLTKNLNDFHPEHENIIFDKINPETENMVPYFHTPIRYRVTEALREFSLSKTVFTELELDTLESFQWLIKIPEFFKPETLFEDLTKEDIEDIVLILKMLIFRDYRVTCVDGNNLRGMITFAKTLLRLFPELMTKTKNVLSSVEARKQIYVNTTTEYLSNLENIVSLFRPWECPSLLSFVRDTDFKMTHVETDFGSDLVVARVLKFLEPYLDSFENYFVMEIQTFVTLFKSFNLEEILKNKDLMGNNLILLECEASLQHETLVNLINIFTRNNSFKIILVTRKTQNQCQIESYCRIKLKDSYLKIPCDGFKWDDLNEKSRAKLLSNKVVRFQSEKEKVSLIDLIGNDWSQIGDILDSLTLMKLIKNESIAIGFELEGLKEIENYYIPRMFEYEETKAQKRLPITSQSEDDLLNELSEGEIVIISNTAGMGKSTVLTSMSLKLKKKNPHLWIFRVNLNDCRQVFAKLLADNKSTFTKENPSLAVKFMLKEILFNNDGTKPNEFETKVLERVLSSRSSGVVIFFDAFDKISPCYEVIVIQFLVSLRYSHIRNIFVTTRPHTSVALDESLGTTAIKMRPFEMKSQIEFLLRFWNLKTPPSDRPRFSFLKDMLHLAYDCVKSLAGSMYDVGNDKIMGNPLQCRILAQYITNSLSDMKAIKISHISLFNMYAFFVQSKFAIYRKDKGLADTTKNNFELPIRGFHQMIALQLIMGKREKLLTDEEMRVSQSEVLKAGILIQMGQNSKFVHRTFAEYFVVDYMMSCSDSDKSTADITNEILLKKEYVVLRTFLNSVFKSDRRRSESILRNYVNDIRCKWTDNESYFTNEMGQTALMIALKEKHKFIYNSFIDILLEKNGFFDTISYIHSKCLKNATALHYACECGSVKCVKRLVENPPNKKTFKWTTRNILNEKNIYGVTPLILACREDHVAIVNYLLANGADVNVSNMAGKTPLHSAIRCGSKKIVSRLIKKGAKIDVTDRNGWTPLQLAINCDKYEIALLLTNNGADCNRRISSGNLSLMYNIFNRCEKSTLLHYVAKRNWCKVVKSFIENGAVIDSRDGNDRTPLHLAAAYLGPSTTHLLIKNGANVKAVDKFKDSLLHISACNDYYVIMNPQSSTNQVPSTNRDSNQVKPARYPFESLRFEQFRTILPKILEKGVDINAQNVFGETPLYKATRCDRLSIVKLLVEHGADVNTFTYEKGWHSKYTPLHVATHFNHVEVARFLLDNGADYEAFNGQNQTPLSLAVEKGYGEMIELLSKHN